SYLEALAKELAGLNHARPVDTLFYGGGTPTHLDAEHLRKLFDLALKWFPLAADGEFSVEANPADLDRAKLDVMTEFGVTRVSLGAQSFASEKLAVLERDHVAGDIVASVEACKSRFDSVSVDLIFAAPNESVDEWHQELVSLIELNPHHISTYGLTYEKGTTFWNRQQTGEFVEADQEVQRAMYLDAIDTLTGAGYEHYEVSNFAQPGHRCRHNEVYWTGESYFAAGPGAARYVDGRRETNHRSVTTYLKRMANGQSPVDSFETLKPEDVAREALVFGLRRIDGIDTAVFGKRFGYSVEQLAGAAIARYVDAGLLAQDDNHLRLTREGLLLSDSMWPAMLRC
ncbi:MAG: radical SAM family heme chaperone HemW, partial [Pirellulales bacterium]|nr:radical SAM family heme chaperone HemW [Pirellulales bacterium]